MRDYGAYSISYGLTKHMLDAERRVTLRSMSSLLRAGTITNPFET